MDKIEIKPAQLPLDVSSRKAAHNTVRAIFHNYYIVKDSAGVPVVYEVNPETNIVKRAHNDHLYRVLALTFVKQGIIHTEKEIKDYVKAWQLTAPELPDNVTPKSFTLHPSEYAFHRLDVSQIAEGPTPTWDVFLAKCGANAEALMAYTWSILDSSTTNSQYLFIKGSGGDGKGSYIRWLTRLMGQNAVAALSAANPYWPAQLLGRRLGVFNELNSTSLVMKSEFKRITGMDDIDISQKYEKTFTVTLDAKFILTTNLPITVSADPAERRRAMIISIEKQANEINVKNYEDKLQEETWAFLFRCKQAFDKLYDAENKYIRCNYEDFEAEASNFDESNEFLFDEAFSVGTDKDEMLAKEFQRVLQEKFSLKDGFKISGLKIYMEREFGIKKVRSSKEGRQWVYKKLKLKQSDTAQVKANPMLDKLKKS